MFVYKVYQEGPEETIVRGVCAARRRVQQSWKHSIEGFSLYWVGFEINVVYTKIIHV